MSIVFISNVQKLSFVSLYEKLARDSAPSLQEKPIMDYSTDIIDKLEEIDIPIIEDELKQKNLYVRFAITGWKVTISRDLRESVFSDCTHLEFKSHKVVNQLRGEKKDGSPFYKHQYLGIIGHKYDSHVVNFLKKGYEIKSKREKVNSNIYYYAVLKKTIFAGIDRALINSSNFVSSRQYTIPESAISPDKPVVLIDMENRTKKYFKIGYRNGKSPSQRQTSTTSLYV